MNVKGKARMLINRPVVADGIEVTTEGGNAIAIVTVKTGSERMRKDFAHFCRTRGVHAEPLADYADGNGQATAYECVGSPAALDELQNWKCVLRFELCIEIPLWRKN